MRLPSKTVEFLGCLAKVYELAQTTAIYRLAWLRQPPIDVLEANPSQQSFMTQTNHIISIPESQVRYAI